MAIQITNKNEDAVIKVECTWGDGPDVLITLKNHPMILASDVIDKDKFKHGIVTDAWIDLTQQEARILAHHLLAAAENVKYLEDNLPK